VRILDINDLPEHMRARAAVELAKQASSAALPAKASKYRNQPITVDGQRFASKLEYACHAAQLARIQTREVAWTLRQISFPFRCGTTYRCDNFNYLVAGGVEVIDAKGVLTKEFQIKARLMKAEYGLEVMLWTRKGMRPFSERSARTTKPSSRSTPGATGAGP
jgi:hypothetical protein